MALVRISRGPANRGELLTQIANTDKSIALPLILEPSIKMEILAGATFGCNARGGGRSFVGSSSAWPTNARLK